MTVKFHEKAITLYGVKQTAEGYSAVRGATGTGTITTVDGDATVTGSATDFTNKIAVGCFIYSAAGYYLGKVLSITDATHLELEVAAEADLNQVVTGSAFTIGKGPVTTGTITTTGASASVTGSTTKFLTEVTVGGYLYTIDDKIIGQVLSIQSDTALTLAAVVPGSPTARSAGVMAISGAVTAVAFKTGLGPANAFAVLNMNYSTELSTEAFQYVGDELDRSEDTVITDKYAKMDFETFLPALGTISGGDPVTAEVPAVDWFQAIGAAIVLSTGSGGYAQATNAVSSNAYLTIQVRRSSPDLATDYEEKVFTITDARGQCDLDMTIGTRVRLKFMYQGNLAHISQATTFVPNYGDQKLVFAPSVTSQTITISSLSPYITASLPDVQSSSNICFDKLSAPNWTGWEYNRYQTGCLDGWSKGAQPTDVTLNVLEDEAYATYRPDDYLEKHHRLTLRWGSLTGYKLEIDFRDLQLTKYTNSKVANYAGQELGFRNVGTTYIKFY